MFTGQKSKGLYTLSELELIQQAYKAILTVNTNTKLIPIKMEGKVEGETKADLLYRRLGHLNYTEIQKLTKGGLFGI